MQIPIKKSYSTKPPLELCHIKLYSTGLKGKVYTNNFYKSMIHNFGIEMQIRNNTSQIQNVNIGGCIYDNMDNTIVRWNTRKQIPARSTLSNDFYVSENTFSQMKIGRYKVQFWVNDKKVQKEFFTITFK